MRAKKEVSTDTHSAHFDVRELNKQIISMLKMASDICGASVCLIYTIKDSEVETLASYGHFDEAIVSGIKKLSDILDQGNGFSLIQDARKHQQAASRLSDFELEKLRFYSHIPLKLPKRDQHVRICLCDPNPRGLTESQKDQLKTIADGTAAQLQLYQKKNQLKEKNERLEICSALLKNAADITFILEPETGIIQDVNDSIQNVLGHTAGSLKGTSFNDIIESDKGRDRSIEEWFSNNDRSGERYSIPVQFISDQDEKRWFECNFTADQNRWYVTAKDISEKKAATEGVYELQDKFKKVISVATDLVYEMDWNSGDLSWGDELTDVLGYPHTDKFVDYDWWIDKIHPDDLQRVIHDVALTVENESRKMKLVYRIRTFDGSYKYVMNHSYIDRDEDGMPVNIIGAIVDVSDLVESEEESDRSKKLLEELADKAWSATWIRDKDGNFLFVNEMYKSLFDLSGRDLRGKNIKEVFDADLAKQFKEKDQKVLESGDPVVFEEQFNINGNHCCFKTNIFPIRDVPGHGEILGGMAFDITEEKKNRELMEKSLKEKETLLREIHHRVKNNLAVVSGMMHLQAYKESDERVQQKLFDGTGRIKTMATIHELLYKSSSFTDLSISESIEQLVTNLIKTYHVSIDLDVSFDLEHVKLNINDAIPCSLIVNEVVTNVLKHAFDDGDSGSLNVSLSEENEKVTLRIRDSGRGLPDDFEKAGDGSSLGMELIQALTIQLEGDYSYTSLDQGVLFELAFKKSDGKGASSGL